MAKVVKYSFVVILALSAISCAIMNKKMASWEGHDISEVIASWGPPDQVIDIGSGNKIYSWSQTRSYTSPGTATTNTNVNVYGNTAYGSSTTTYNPPKTTTRQATRSFWVNSSGNIYKWAWRGL
ncbi:MAG TPA: hypothetical protein PLQ05_07720 [Acidobacteriota bacterium]|nr:hypothetical protein [Acidobacteriota bacterium]HNT18060.1 hypothetical protein [Acidobacteriota bacterium]HPA27525.1 hypothetical protein [Acidobacteriota bacterium]HQO18968.1 hypothetical protein [Acidobacteriota bacterium]